VQAARIGVVAVAGLVLLSAAPSAEARVTCSFSGPPENALTVTANRTTDWPGVTRGGQEIVVRQDLKPPTACSGGVPTVLNTDTITFRLRGGFPAPYVMLAGGPFAPGATLEAEGTSEIEIEIRGSGFVVVYGTAGADAFQWGPGSPYFAGLNLNPGEGGDQDVDVTTTNEIAPLLAKGLAGNDMITTSPSVMSPAYIDSGGGPGDDRLSAGRNAGGRLGGDAGDDVLIGSRFADGFLGGPGNDRLVGGGGADLIDPAGSDPGNDLILAGPGPDEINTRDSRRDIVKCGSGRDRVRADRQDRLRGCEVIRR
jgi:Ca2+-binding RTX toxin-like protein